MRIAMGIPRAMVVNDDVYRWAFSSLVCAALALVIAPVVFGSLGVVAGTVAVWKGGRWWGAAGVYASAIVGVVGFYFAGGLIA